MRIAIPVRGEQFCEHFGHSEGFFLCDVEEPSRAVVRLKIFERPRSKCESLLQWLQELRVQVMLAGGIGPVGRRHLEEQRIRVCAGYEGRDPQQIINALLAGSAGGENPRAGFEHRHHH